MILGALLACTEQPSARTVQISGDAFTLPPIQSAPIFMEPEECVTKATLTIECSPSIPPYSTVLVCVNVVDADSGQWWDWDTSYDSMCSDYVPCQIDTRLTEVSVKGHTRSGISRFVSIGTNNWILEDNNTEFQIWGASVEISESCP